MIGAEAGLLHGAELEAPLGRAPLRLECEAAGTLVLHGLLLLVVDAKVVLQDLHRHVVDLVVLVPLELLDLVHAAAHLHHQHELVRPGRREVPLAALEDVLDALEGHGHDAHVGLIQQVDEGRHTPLVDEVLDLHVVAARRRVRDRPRALLADVKVLGLEHLHQRRDDLVIHDGLQLLLAPGSDVGDGPARLLADALALVAEEGQQAREHRAVDDELGLVVVARHHVADSPESRRLDLGGLVHEKLDEATAHARVDHRLDLFVGPVREVRERPARVS
mmetsp:Transcript_64071/g.152837  ORF Transcript_64071/g.152837 Transcript_64071/m.152837 type:complete len:277 (+) Transcript_64071:317-1147(+)